MHSPDMSTWPCFLGCDARGATCQVAKAKPKFQSSLWLTSVPSPTIGFSYTHSIRRGGLRTLYCRHAQAPRDLTLRPKQREQWDKKIPQQLHLIPVTGPSELKTILSKSVFALAPQRPEIQHSLNECKCDGIRITLQNCN